MKLENLIKIGIALVVFALLVVVVIKPTVNSRFHVKYVDNLVALEALRGSLIRNHLLVSHGHVRHYDFLEADLQKMERYARLATFTPDHAGEQFQDFAQEKVDEYLSTLEKVRNSVELGKRGTGLLNNSLSAMNLLLDQLNESQLGNTQEFNNTAAMPFLIGLNQAFREKSDFDGIHDLLEKLTATQLVDETLTARLRLHTDILERFVEPVDSASDTLYALTQSLDQPQAVRQEYLLNYDQTLMQTTVLLWFTYAFASILVGLAMLLSIVASRAKRETEKAIQVAESEKTRSEQQIADTRLAVRQCNVILEKVARGDFSERIEQSFNDELEDLRTGVNQAADSVQFTMHELHRVMDHMQDGDFTTQLDERVTGDFREQVERTNHRLQSIMTVICNVMKDMKDGDFSSRIDMEISGSFDVLKVSVNESMTYLGHSLGEISSIMELQAKGDFTTRLKNQWPGQLGALGGSLNVTVDSIQAMVEEIQQLSQQVTHVSQSVLESSEMLSMQSDKQADAIDTAFQRSHTVGELIKTNNSATLSATELSARSHQQAGDCRKSSMNSVETMQGVTKKITEITGITDTLESIASKTNLLALNAAVEASRAGETGKGFSVVAGEVKALARLSADAAANIGHIVRDAESEVKRGSSAASSASTALEAIEASVLDVEKINREISDACQAQSDEMASVSKSVNEAFELTRTNQNMASDTLSTSKELDVLAQKMSRLVGVFKVAQNTPLKKAA